MLSAHCWFHLRVEQRQNHSRLPSSRLTMQIMFRLVSADLSRISIVSVQVILKEVSKTFRERCHTYNDRTTRAYLGSALRIMFRLVFSVIRLQVPFDECKALVHSWCSPDPSYARDPSTIRPLCMLFRKSSSSPQ